MARPSILAAYNKSMSDLAIVERYLQKSKHLPPEMYGFVAEVLMLRIFSILESSVREISTRIACGVPYKNGVASTPMIKSTSIQDAINKFKCEGRRNSLQNLKFTNVSGINYTIKYVIDSSEPFRVNLSKYGVQFEEMRKVRNHIAHRYKNTYTDYKDIIKSRYGAYIKLKPSVFLTSTKRQPRAIIDEYLITVRVIINDITDG